MAPGKKKIAVLGGGCGSMAAVWALTHLPDWDKKFDITVYQIGWRLGGKCASGRDEQNHNRIYEHGLHIWGGFYQNAFRMMDELYREWGPDPNNPIAAPPNGAPAWQNAFQSLSDIILQENVNGQLINWELHLPDDNAGYPGTGGVMPTAWEYIVRIIKEIARRFRRRAPTPPAEPLKQKLTLLLEREDFVPAHGSIFPELLGKDSKESMVMLRAPVMRPALTQFNVIDIIDTATQFSQVPATETYAIWQDDLLHFVEEAARLFIERYTVPGSDDRRRLEFTLDLVIALARGIIRSGVLQGGWEVINALEWSDWLRSSGAQPETLASPLVRGIYDYVFAFVKGEPGNRQLEAGTATHGVLRLFFTYKGAFFWEMLAGMGDVVFAPLYLVLKNRVTFKFFSRVKKIEVEDGQVAAIEIEEQATTKNGQPYDPLIKVRGVPAWPAHPRYAQLNEGDELKQKDVDLESHWADWSKNSRRLIAGTDFDAVLLGISLGALSDIAADVAAARSEFHAMLENVRTVQTHSMQLWFDADKNQLGAPLIRRAATAAPEPIATWSDMSFQLAREAWPSAPAGTKTPRYLAYFCGELNECGDPTSNDFPMKMLDYFKNKVALPWLQQYLGSIWKAGLNFDLLHDDANGIGVDRLWHQYFRVNINPSDRYVASFPGTSQWRMRADQPVLPNLFIAGDWVKTPFNAGCVEAAVMGGLYAARAISGESIDIIGG